ncbi:hypothetical protein VTG60DRAFT_7312 [Thermothelomyces hinnuleus]
MASAPSAKTVRILAKAMRDRLGYDGPDDCITSIRCNGREFHIEMSPFYICDSPAVESRYRARPAEFVDGERGSGKNGCLEELFPQMSIDEDKAPDEDSRILTNLISQETTGRRHLKALCYEDVLLMVITSRSR